MCRNTPDSDPALRPGERVDDLELEGLRIIQNPDAFCFGTDSVLLADFARAKKENRVLDLGTGCGVLLLLLWGRYHPQELVGVEIQPQMADIARRNVAFNRLESVARVVEGDYKRHGEAFPKAKFDLVVANPPYVKLGAGAGRENQAHYIARHEVAATLADVVEAASAALITGGRFCMVHHPHRLAEIITAMRGVRIEPKRMKLVQPREDKPANILLIEGIKNGRSGMHFEPTLSVYGPDGDYTASMQRVYGRKI